MWYILPESNKHYPLTINRVKEIQRMNAQGLKPDDLEPVEVVSSKPKEVEPEFVDVVGQTSLRSLERNSRRKDDRDNRNNNERRGNNDQRGNGNPNQQNRAAQPQGGQNRNPNQQQGAQQRRPQPQHKPQPVKDGTPKNVVGPRPSGEGNQQNKPQQQQQQRPPQRPQQQRPPQNNRPPQNRPPQQKPTVDNKNVPPAENA